MSAQVSSIEELRGLEGPRADARKVSSRPYCQIECVWFENDVGISEDQPLPMSLLEADVLRIWLT